MEKVSGIGGFFFKSSDPGSLAQWYAQYLGINPVPTTADESPWQQSAGPTAFAPSPSDSEFFQRESQTWGINFRVPDLDAMVSQLRSADIEVEVDPEAYPFGKFASLVDPEGNPIQLWEVTGEHAEDKS